MRAVAITGMGVVSPLGHDLDTFWRRIVAGETAIGPITTIPTDRLQSRLIAEIKDFDPEHHFGRHAASLDRFSQFAVVAARAAVKDANLDLTREDSDVIPVVMGTGSGGQTTIDAGYEAFYGRGAPRVPPLTVPKFMGNAAVSQVSMALGLRGESYSIASACASATHAIGLAYRMVRSGVTDVAITGGSEASLAVGCVKAWEALRVMSNDGCRPFSKNRNGMILGEGSGILVLESIDHAIARGARIHACILGFGATADAGDLTSPTVAQVSRAMRLAIKDAGLASSDIDYINAHGTGTLMNDATEVKALHDVFGPYTAQLLVSSIKGALGHSLGAAGAFEAIATALALRDQIAPPTAGWTEPDPDCNIDPVPGCGRTAALRAALSNSFAFGGLNAVLALGRV